MANDLATVMTQAGGPALVEKFIVAKFMERKENTFTLANAENADIMTLPDKSGQFVELRRKKTVRRPANVNNATPNADPLSGVQMGMDKYQYPIEFIHEYGEVGKIANMTSFEELEAWLKDELIEAYDKRLHELTQNAFKVGRFLPGIYDANGAESTPFDTTVESTMSVYGASFTFAKAPSYYGMRRNAFSEIQPEDRITWGDFENVKLRLVNSGARKINGAFHCHLSEASSSILQQDDKYFAEMVHANGGKGLKEGKIIERRGWRFFIDEEPFTENFGAPNVRAVNGPIHTSICYGAHAFGYLRLGGKSVARPSFKVQDISKTGKVTSIGYTIPFQVAAHTPAWCATITAPVDVSETNG